MLKIIFTIKEQNRPEPGTLYLDIRAGHREVRRDRRRFKLPLRQFKMLQALCANYPAPMTHWDLFYHVWGEGTQDRLHFTDEDGGPLTPNSCIQQHAARLRRNLAFMGLSVTSPRKGYGYEIKEIKCDEATITLQEASPTQALSAEEESPAPSTARDPRGSKAKPVLRAAKG